MRLIIERRLERFNEHEKRVLAAAAMIGRSFSFRLLTAVSKIDVDELFTVIEKAQQMGVIVASSEGPEQPFTFAHELVRQTILAGISAPRKQQLHAGVADAIEQLYPRFVIERAGVSGPHNPTILKTQIPTATTTTTLRIVLILAAMGMKRFIIHNANPTTIKATTRFT